MHKYRLQLCVIGGLLQLPRSYLYVSEISTCQKTFQICEVFLQNSQAPPLIKLIASIFILFNEVKAQQNVTIIMLRNVTTIVLHYCGNVRYTK